MVNLKNLKEGSWVQLRCGAFLKVARIETTPILQVSSSRRIDTSTQYELVFDQHEIEKYYFAPDGKFGRATVPHLLDIVNFI